VATEQGIVIKTDSSAAWVKTIKTGDCAGCTARGSCHSLGNNADMEVKAINEAGAIAGDRIVLLFETSSLLKATFLLYVFPILLLIIGAAIGQEIAQSFRIIRAYGFFIFYRCGAGNQIQGQ